MRVCQFIPDGAIPDRRGFAPAIVAQNIVKSFKENGIDYFFVSDLEEYEFFEEESAVGKVYRLHHSNLYKRIFKKITRLDPNPFYKQLANILNKNRVDILHIHQLEFPINKFKELMEYDLKIVVHAHALRTFKIERGVADLYLAVSKYTKNRMVKDFNYPEDRVEVLYNGVDTSLFSKTDSEVEFIRNRFKIGKNDIIVSYIGRKQEAKGFFISLQVFKELLSRYKNIKIFSVGPTPKDVVKDKHYEEEQELLKELGQNENFINLPALQHSELSNIYKITDILLFPTKAEQHPLVSVESLASGNILITSKVSSLPEYIKDGENGFLVNNPEDFNEVFSNVLRVIDDLNNLEDIKENAIKTGKRFDWHHISDELLEIYDRVLLRGSNE